jgi:hypothetical protein
MGGGFIVRDENAGGPYHAYKSLSGSYLSDFYVTLVFNKMIPKKKKKKTKTKNIGSKLSAKTCYGYLVLFSLFSDSLGKE